MSSGQVQHFLRLDPNQPKMTLTGWFGSGLLLFFFSFSSLILNNQTENKGKVKNYLVFFLCQDKQDRQSVKLEDETKCDEDWRSRKKWRLEKSVWGESGSAMQGRNEDEEEMQRPTKTRLERSAMWGRDEV